MLGIETLCFGDGVEVSVGNGVEETGDAIGTGGVEGVALVTVPGCVADELVDFVGVGGVDVAAGELIVDAADWSNGRVCRGVGDRRILGNGIDRGCGSATEVFAGWGTSGISFFTKPEDSVVFVNTNAHSVPSEISPNALIEHDGVVTGTVLPAF